LGKSFPLVVNISGYAFGYASLKRHTLRKAEGHAARQFIYYEKKDVNPRTSSGEAIRSSDFGPDDQLHEKQMICLLTVPLFTCATTAAPSWHSESPRMGKSAPRPPAPAPTPSILLGRNDINERSNYDNHPWCKHSFVEKLKA
jgi:hypothetical protein